MNTIYLKTSEKTNPHYNVDSRESKIDLGKIFQGSWSRLKAALVQYLPAKYAGLKKHAKKTKPKNMLFDIRMINSSGIGVYIKALLPGLCNDLKTTLLADDIETLDESTKPDTLIVHAPIYSIKEQLTYLTLPSTDVLFSPHYNVPIFPVRSKKRVVTIHDVIHLAFFSQLTLAQKLYSKLVLNLSVRLSDAIITVSEFSKAEIIKYTGCSAEKITVIPNGVRQTANYKPKDAVRIKYGLPENYLLYVGNVKPHKNLKTLVAAYASLSSDMREKYKLVIAGKMNGFITEDPALFEFINATPELSSNVTFTGYVADDDMDTLYSAASLMIFPSLYEGFGLPPLEAMLNKCPVAASNTASIQEICGDAALFFNPRDKAEIADKITLLLKDDLVRQKLIAMGEARIKKFTWDNSLEKHLSLLHGFL